MERVAAGLVAAVLRRLPLKSGHTTIAQHPFVRRLTASLPATVGAPLRSGATVEVSPRDFDGRSLYLFGTSDTKVGDVCVDLLAEGDVFLDIGANHGSIGLEAANAVGALGEVHFFEPQAHLAERIEKAIGGRENLFLHRFGLFDRNASLELKKPPDHSGMGSFSSDAPWPHLYTEHEICEVRDTEQALSPLIRGRAFGVKLDVEGSEMKIMPWLVLQPSFRFVVFEATLGISELLQLAWDAGLAIYGFLRRPFSVQLSRLDPSSDLSAFHDLLAFRASGSTLPATATPRELSRLIA